MKDGLKLRTEKMQLVFEKLVHGSDTKTYDSDARRLKDKKKKRLLVPIKTHQIYHPNWYIFKRYL